MGFSVGQATETADLGGGRRLVVAPDAMTLESRSGSVWMPGRRIPWTEVRAIYRYEERDWAYAGRLFALWFGLMVVIGVAASIVGMPGTRVLLMLLVTTLGIGALAAYRVSAVPRRLVMVDAYGAPLVLEERDGGIFGRVSSRLPSPASVLETDATEIVEALSPPAAAGQVRAFGLEPPQAPAAAASVADPLLPWTLSAPAPQQSPEAPATVTPPAPEPTADQSSGSNSSGSP